MFTNAFFVWLILSVLGFIFEMGHPGLFFFLSFSIGALLAAISTSCISSIATQVVILFIGTLLGFFMLKSWLKNHRDFVQDAQNTNVYALAKKCGSITFADGDIVQAKVDGQIWTVRSDDRFKVGDNVQVLDVKGCKLIVKRLG